MLGEQKQTFFTVKDLSAQEFIEAFSQYLKKNNLVERPVWADYVKSGSRTSSPIQATSSLPSTTTGST
jgi:ribosomal protein S19E (S16A)